MSNPPRFRWLSTRLPSLEKPRLVVLTGARQTGKTTLARRHFAALAYQSLDDMVLREALRQVPAVRWAKEVGAAILDEAQKEPSVFEKVKYAFDAGDLRSSVLLGSSRILLLDHVRETLAGRAFVYDLYPLMASEVRWADSDRPEPPLIDRLLTEDSPQDLLRNEPVQRLPQHDEPARAALAHVQQWGGMPELLRLGEQERHEWLRSYIQTFLERDLLDLVRLSDLQPFSTLQRLCMLRSGNLLNYSDLARDAAIAPKTAQRYLEYLRISYQVLLLPPYATNLTSRVVKSPKVYWADLGLLRSATNQWQTSGGTLFETAVVVELHKWISTLARPASLTFYRTTSGMEVDALIETAAGVLAIEIKDRDGADRSDCRGLRALQRELGARWRAGLVVHRGRTLELLDAGAGIWSVPAHRLLV